MKIMDENKPKKLNQLLAGVAACGGGFVIGNVIGWASPAESMIAKSMNITEVQFGWIASIMAVGAAFSQILIAIFMDLAGRRWSFVIFSALTIFSWVVLIVLNSFYGMIAGRFLMGLFAGGFCVISPTYIAEITHKSIRGSVSVGFQLLLTIGILYSYIFCAFKNLWALNICCIIPPIVVLVAFVFLKETPVYLMKNNNEPDAVKVLQFYRGKDYDVTTEMNEIKMLTAKEDVKFCRALKKKTCLKAFLMLLGMHVVQQLSGINAIMFYAESIFIDTATFVDACLSQIVLGFVQVIATGLSAAIVDRIGRKILWYVSLFIMAVCLILVGIYFQIMANDKEIAERINLLPVFSIFIYIIGFSLGCGPLPWVMIGELIPTRVKSFVAMIIAALNWMLAFVISLTYPMLKDEIGTYVVFYMYGIVAILGIVFVRYCIIETKNKSLEEIQEQLKTKKEEKETKK